MSIVNRPRVSASITRFYWAMAASMGLLGLLIIVRLVPGKPMPQAVVAASFVLVEAIMLAVISSLHDTRFILSDSELLIRSSFLVGGNKRIGLDEVVSIERTAIPWGFILCGAAFHGGLVYFPGLGCAHLTMTNFVDGLLIRAGRRRYIITPRDPDVFKNHMERRMADSLRVRG